MLVFVSLGFDLCEVGQEEVILKTGNSQPDGPCTLRSRALLALFGKSTLQLPGATGTALGMVWEGEELSERMSAVCQGMSKNKLLLLDLSLWCARVHSICQTGD